MEEAITLFLGIFEITAHRRATGRVVNSTLLARST